MGGLDSPFFNEMKKLLLTLILALAAVAGPEPCLSRPEPKPEVVYVWVERPQDLDMGAVKGAAQAMYDKWDLTFVWVDHPSEAPKDSTAIAIWAAPAEGRGKILGAVPIIDEWNKEDERIIEDPDYGIFVATHVVCYKLQGRKPTKPIVSMAVGLSLAHEVGHLLGLWHLHTYKPYLMGVGSPFLPHEQSKWGPQSEAYLDLVLPKKKQKRGK